MVIGNILLQRNEQYVADRDAHGTWRILNTWHQELKSLGIDADVPDDHPAVTLVTEGAFLALIKEATSRGILSEMTRGTGDISFDEHEVVCKERDKLKEELENREDMEPASSESLKIAESKLALIDRLASLNVLDENIIKMVLSVGGNQEIK